MKKIFVLMTMLWAVLALQAQEHETPNAQQARRLFNETYKMIYSGSSQITDIGQK